MKLHQISVSNQTRRFSETPQQGVYKVYFDNCVSILDLRNLTSQHLIMASTRWNGCESSKDLISIVGEVVSPNFPIELGYSVYQISWSSGDVPDIGYLVLA
ncbi:hypothetical protein FR279_22670 [Vibrio vulnificus]|uniref:hypothetical protein n=1 Tax=Vibrio vulnificus TaxID=672 RepID=UPI000576C47B|nr:hypothetical protein [Vibrio vulnificus]EGQ7984330.1 hypothetical protein [Vibrio vulnificus]EGQ9994424.1 hypothetical protein [Vibrio vulnificus]